MRLAIEAAVRQGWERFIGEDGGFIGMTGFGASAPAERLYTEFGITAEAVVGRRRDKLRPDLRQRCSTAAAGVERRSGSW